MKNVSIFIAAVAAMFLMASCMVVPGTGEELTNNDGYDYEPITDDEVNDSVVKDDVVNDNNNQTDETADEDVVKDDIDDVDTDTVSDNDVDNAEEDLEASISAPEKINENGGVAEVYVTLNRAEKHDISASLSFSGDAIRTTDYLVTGLNGDKLLILAGQKSAKFQIESVNNDKNNGNREIVVTLNSNSYFEIKDKESRVTILEDDGTFNGEFNFESVSATITENSSSADTATITVKRSVSTDKVAVTVVATGDLSRLTFNPSGDYLNGKEVEFLHGESVKTFTVKVGNDNIAQPELKVNFKLRTPTGNTTIGSNKEFNLTVKDDDGGTEKEVQTASGPTNYCTDWYVKPTTVIKHCVGWGEGQGGGTKIIENNIDGHTKFTISGWCSVMCYDANGNPSAQFEAGGKHTGIGNNTNWFQKLGCSILAIWNGDNANKCQ